MSEDRPGDDHELWQRVREDDRDAFDTLFLRHHAAVFSYAFRLLADRHHAEDAVAQAFLDTWRRRDHVNVDPKAQLLPWLIAVTHRTASNTRRSQTRWLRLQAHTPAELPLPDHADHVADRVDDEHLMQAALAMVNRLKDSERDVFLLCVWGERTYAEAAAALAVPVGTVRSRLSRAKSHLRDMAATNAQVTRSRVE